MAGNSSRYTIQSVVDFCRTFPDIKPVLGEIGGYGLEPALTICNDVMQFMLAEGFPWKFNEILIPPFYTNSWQQDYAVPGVTNVGWLQSVNVVDINNTSIPKPRYAGEVGRDFPKSSANLTSNGLLARPRVFVCWENNDQLYYGTWGGANGTTEGNDPVANSVYTNPIGQQSQPSNPITQIRDANGNLLVLTTYGHEGSAAPVLPAGSAAGTTVSGSGATTVWTVVDPKGQGFRIFPIPSQSGTVWQVNLVAQARPPIFTSFQQFIDPIPDDYATYFRQGVLTYSYRHSGEASVRGKFETQMQVWVAALAKARGKSDRERDENAFIPDGSFVAPISGGWFGPAWPFADTPNMGSY